MAARLVERRLHDPALEDGVLLLARQVATAGEAGQGGVPVDVAGEQDEVVARHRSGVMLARPAAAGTLAAERVVQLAAASREAQLLVSCAGWRARGR